MRVIISGFRCYAQTFELDIKGGETTLLSGASGQGKTTIFQALTWCLFGAVRNVNCKSDPKARLSVTIYDGSLKIYRQKGPGLLVVQKEGKEYQDDVAQSIIFDYYVTIDLWSVVAYINQGESNALLSKSAAERMDILNTLAFNGDDPDVVINKLEEAHSGAEKNMVIQRSLLQDSINLFNQHNADYKLEMTVSREEKALIIGNEKNKLQELLKEEERLREERVRYEVAARSNDLIMGECRQLQSIVEKVPPLLAPLQEANKQAREELRQQEEAVRFAPLYEELAQLQNATKDLIMPGESLSTIEQRLQQSYAMKLWREQGVLIVNKYNLAYDVTVVQNEMKKLNTELTMQDDLRLKIEIEKLQKSLSVTPQINEEEGRKRLQQLQILAATLQRDQQVKKDLLILQVQIDAIVGDIPENLITSIETEEKRLYNLEQAKNDLQCPHCSNTVRLQGTLLVKCENRDHSVSTAELSACREAILRMKALSNKKTLLERSNQLRSYLSGNDQPGITAESVYQEIAILNYQLAQLQERKMVQGRMLQLQSMIRDNNAQGTLLDAAEAKSRVDKVRTLQGIVFYPEQEKIILSLQTNLNICKTFKRMEEIRSLLGARPCSTTSPELAFQPMVGIANPHRVKQLQTVIKESTQRIEQAQREHMEHNAAVVRMQELKQKVLVCLDPTARLLTTQQHIAQSRKTIADGEKYISLYTEYIILQAKYQEVSNLQARLTDITRLRALAKDVECYKLEQIVNDLNNHINDICSSLFPVPINVRVELYKTAKTTGRSKPNVNLIIDYKGMQYDSVTQLSGGERDRISLALTLAMNKISGCPILLLDEVMSTFDASLKDIAVKCISQHTAGKTVMLICHSTVTGVFPHVIDLD